MMRPSGVKWAWVARSLGVVECVSCRSPVPSGWTVYRLDTTGSKLNPPSGWVANTRRVPSGDQSHSPASIDCGVTCWRWVPSAAMVNTAVASTCPVPGLTWSVQNTRWLPSGDGRGHLVLVCAVGPHEEHAVVAELTVSQACLESHPWRAWRCGGRWRG